METDAHIANETYAERARLVALLEDLTPEQWASPSLCAGWRVSEVVAHLTMAYRTKPLRMLGGLVRARFSFNRYAELAARADTQTMSDDELLAYLRTNIRNPWQPPGGGAVGALSHDVIHGLDITESLGLPGPPPERIALVLQNTGPRNLKYFGVDLDGKQLEATDVDVTIGQGAAVPLSAKEMLLVITGRRPLADSTSDRTTR